MNDKTIDDKILDEEQLKKFIEVDGPFYMNEATKNKLVHDLLHPGKTKILAAIPIVVNPYMHDGEVARMQVEDKAQIYRL